jgi:hypothetical protein
MRLDAELLPGNHNVTLQEEEIGRLERPDGFRLDVHHMACAHVPEFERCPAALVQAPEIIAGGQLLALLSFSPGQRPQAMPLPQPGSKLSEGHSPLALGKTPLRSRS